MQFGSLDWYEEVGRTIDTLYHEQLGRAPDPSGLFNLLWHAREHGWTDVEMRQFLHESPEGVAYRATPTLPPLPPPHTRAEAAGIRTHFQGLEYHLSTGVYKDVLVWSDDLSEADRFATYQTHLDAGDRHEVCNLSALYYPTARLPIAGRGWDYTANLPLFKARLREMITRGLIPLCALAGDGQTYNPDGGTYGWQWLMDNLPRLAAALKGEPGSECPDGEDFISSRLMVPFLGFELVTPPGGNWTPDQFFQAYLRARDVFGAEAVLAAQIGGYAWPGEGAISHGTSVEVMSSPPMLAIDVMLAEWNNPVPESDPGWRERRNGMEQITTGWLGPATNRSALRFPVENTRPFYLAAPTPRGPRVAVAFERALAGWVRNELTQAVVDRDAAEFRALGWTYVS